MLKKLHASEVDEEGLESTNDLATEHSNDHREKHTTRKEKYHPGTAMENFNVLLSDLPEEQRDILRRDFIADANYLKNHEKMNQSFWELFVKCLATTNPPILTTEEKNNLLNGCSVLPGGCAASLKAIEKEGARAIAILYLLLKRTNPSGYRQLPSSKGKDEKLKLLKRLESKLMLSQGANSSHASMDEDTQACEKNSGSHQQAWWRMGIQKDDEFFHFVVTCFAIGALLICYYYKKDWTISVGVGLVTFASLEATGLYFGLVYRIGSVLDIFALLVDRLRPKGMWKAS